MDEAIKLQPGSYFDNEEMLHGPDGELLPDGVYQKEDGEIFMYEGNFANLIANAK